MFRIKRIDYQKIFIYIMFLIMVSGIIISTMDNMKYEPIIFGNSNFLLPKRITENADRTDGDNYVFLQSDDYLVLGIGPDNEYIDDKILKKFNITMEDLYKVKTINNEYDLMKLINDNDGALVYNGRTNKYSYDKFFIQFRSDNYEKIILVFCANNKNVIEIIIAPKYDISQKEIVKMHGNMRYR